MGHFRALLQKTEGSNPDKITEHWVHEYRNKEKIIFMMSKRIWDYQQCKQYKS